MPIPGGSSFRQTDRGNPGGFGIETGKRRPNWVGRFGTTGNSGFDGRRGLGVRDGREGGFGRVSLRRRGRSAGGLRRSGGRRTGFRAGGCGFLAGCLAGLAIFASLLCVVPSRSPWLA